MHRTAAIISQGDEIVIGQTLDTNSRWIAARLLDAGVVPVEHVSLPDDRKAIASTFGRLSAAVDLIVCSGGLGPTADDLTRFALADAMGDTLVQDGESLRQIEAWFAARGRPMIDLNRVQAMRPSRGTVLSNLHGTAPGICAKLGSCDVYCLPGPPRELMPMFETFVLPRLEPDGRRTVRVRVLHTIGLGESEIAARFRSAPGGDLMDRERVPLVGTTASNSVVSCRIRYEGTLAPAEAEALIARDEATIRSLIGEAVFGEDDETLASVIVKTLKARGQTVATVESCTGGLIASQITDIAGASDVFRSGWVTYSNETKVREVGVPASLFKGSAGGTESGAPGAVSREVAAAMAAGGAGEADADFAIAVTGIAGPGGGSAEKPAGTVYVAVAGRACETDVRRFAFTGDRAAVREWSARAGLAMLWLTLSGRRGVRLLRQVDGAPVC
ncbi:MAG: CinA family nicotinamide mononucleotide deamidase-related protein [Phycisphaerales bacterium]|nr:CinA family nicotinamide mononucleotide deamidase-related protein [Planctomycetota bacterium]